MCLFFGKSRVFQPVCLFVLSQLVPTTSGPYERHGHSIENKNLEIVLKGENFTPETENCQEITRVPCPLLVPVADKSLDFGHVNISVFPRRSGNSVDQEGCCENRQGGLTPTGALSTQQIEKPQCTLQQEKGRVWSSDTVAAARGISWADSRPPVDFMTVKVQEQTWDAWPSPRAEMLRTMPAPRPPEKRMGKRVNWMQPSHT